MTLGVFIIFCLVFPPFIFLFAFSDLDVCSIVTMLATVLELFFFCQRMAKSKCWTPNRESLLLSPTIRVRCLRICGSVCDTIILFDVIRMKLLQDLNSYFARGRTIYFAPLQYMIARVRQVSTLWSSVSSGVPRYTAW